MHSPHVTIMGITKEEQQTIVTISCALLHSSNVTFLAISPDECEIDVRNMSLEPALQLLGITLDTMNRALCHVEVKFGKDRHARSLPSKGGRKNLEALIKAVYKALFKLILDRLNKSINYHTQDKNICTDWVATMAYSPDGNYLATGSWDNTVKIWSATEGESPEGEFIHLKWIVMKP